MEPCRDLRNIQGSQFPSWHQAQAFSHSRLTHDPTILQNFASYPQQRWGWREWVPNRCWNTMVRRELHSRSCRQRTSSQHLPRTSQAPGRSHTQQCHFQARKRGDEESTVVQEVDFTCPATFQTGERAQRSLATTPPDDTSGQKVLGLERDTDGYELPRSGYSSRDDGRIWFDRQLWWWVRIAPRLPACNSDCQGPWDSLRAEQQGHHAFH